MYQYCFVQGVFKIHAVGISYVKYGWVALLSWFGNQTSQEWNIHM